MMNKRFIGGDQMELPQCLWLIGGLFFLAGISAAMACFIKPRRKFYLLAAHLLFNIGLIIWGERCGWFLFLLFLFYGLILAFVVHARTKNGCRWAFIVHTVFTIGLLIKAYPFAVMTIFMFYIEWGWL